MLGVLFCDKSAVEFKNIFKTYRTFISYRVTALKFLSYNYPTAPSIARFRQYVGVQNELSKRAKRGVLNPNSAIC